MMTSRAEFRLLLREDNAADRLMPIGRELGLIDDARWSAYTAWQAELVEALARAHGAFVTGTPAVNDLLAKLGSAPIQHRRASLAELGRRPELDWRAVEQIAIAGGLQPSTASEQTLERVAIELQYAGYLRRQESEAARVAKADAVVVPAELDYRTIPGLSREAIEKLEAIRPRSVGQASRISGVTPAAVAILLTYLSTARRAAVERT